jgi:hypothetical protein
MMKEALQWIAAGVLFLAIVLIVITGGGILDPSFWHLLFL